MDLAKNLASWRELSPEQWIAQANRLLPPIVVAALVIAIAYRLAGLTWQLLEAPPDPDRVPGIAVAGASPGRGAASAYQTLTGWRPFGEPPPAGAALRDTLPIDAPETTLQLELWGLNSANRDEAASATVSAGGGRTQHTYLIGDEIEGANAATLYAVFPDHIIIRFPDGRFERKSLDDDAARQARERNTPRTLTSSARQALPEQTSLSQAVTLREALTNVGAVLAENIRIAPELEGGQVIGYRLQPGQNEEIFDVLGFEPGDVLIEVNGIKLNNPQNAAQVFTALGEATQANVIVRRNDQQQALVVDMSQVQRLTESRQ